MNGTHSNDQLQLTPWMALGVHGLVSLTAQREKSLPANQELPSEANDQGSKSCNPSERDSHEYHDFANHLLGVAEPPCVPSNNTSVDEAFPVRLHYMLNDIEQDGLAHVISWQPHGRSFLVHNKKAFVEDILGSWFRMSKVPSFQRQLNLYGFRRLSTGPDKGAYYHVFFLRERGHLARRIQRFKVKGQGMRKAADPRTEPNLYSYPFLPPTPTSTTMKSTPEDKTAAVPHPEECRVAAAQDLVAAPSLRRLLLQPALAIHDPMPMIQQTKHLAAMRAYCQRPSISDSASSRWLEPSSNIFQTSGIGGSGSVGTGLLMTSPNGHRNISTVGASPGQDRALAALVGALTDNGLPATATATAIDHLGRWFLL